MFDILLLYCQILDYSCNLKINVWKWFPPEWVTNTSLMAFIPSAFFRLIAYLLECSYSLLFRIWNITSIGANLEQYGALNRVLHFCSFKKFMDSFDVWIGELTNIRIIRLWSISKSTVSHLSNSRIKNVNVLELFRVLRLEQNQSP